MSDSEEEKPKQRLAIEHAKSGRASCKKCKEKIEKDELRIGKEVMFRDNPSMQWFHAQCFKKPKKVQYMRAIDLDGWETIDIDEAQRQTIMESFEDGGSTDMRVKVKKRKKQEEDDDDFIVEEVSGTPKKKKAKAGSKKSKSEIVWTSMSPSKSELKGEKFKEKKDEISSKYSQLTISALKEILRGNNQPVSGKKDELVERCVDGELFGQLPKCPRCEKGHLRIEHKGSSKDESTFVYKCSGYFDADMMAFCKCAFNSGTGIKIERTKWLHPGEYDEAAAQPNAKKDKKTSALLDADQLKEFESLTDRKDICSKLVDICVKQGLSIPENAGSQRLKIGQSLMEHMTDDGGFDIQAAYGDLAKTFPKKTVKKETGKSAMHPANSSIVDLLEEYARLEAKAKKPNFGFKVSGLRNAAAAIAELDYEVTSGAQISKGKGKVKGVGKSTGFIVDEFIATGKKTAAKVEELKKYVDALE